MKFERIMLTLALGFLVVAMAGFGSTLVFACGGPDVRHIVIPWSGVLGVLVAIGTYVNTRRW